MKTKEQKQNNNKLKLNREVYLQTSVQFRVQEQNGRAMNAIVSVYVQTVGDEQKWGYGRIRSGTKPLNNSWSGVTMSREHSRDPWKNRRRRAIPT